MMNNSVYESIKDAYDNGELEEYLDNHDNVFFITEKLYDGSHICRYVIFTISGCRINTMEYTITDIDGGNDGENVTIMSPQINDAINSYGQFLSGL